MARMQGRVELQLERRQIAGIITGALLVLALAFGLGVGFGRRLMQAPSPETAASELAKLDDASAPGGLTFHQELTDAPAGTATAPSAAPAPVPEPKAAPKVEAPHDQTTGYCVQFGSFPVRDDADKLSLKLHDLGYAAKVTIADIPGKGRHYRVRVGQYDNRDQAEKLRSEAMTRHKLTASTMPLP
jgi:cell division protein FtsN